MLLSCQHSGVIVTYVHSYLREYSLALVLNISNTIVNLWYIINLQDR